MSDTASSPATMRGYAIRACCEEMVLMNDLPLPTPGPHDILMGCVVRKSAIGTNWCAPARRSDNHIAGFPPFDSTRWRRVGGPVAAGRARKGCRNRSHDLWSGASLNFTSV